MPHYCEAALITCEDYRLHQRKDGRNYIADFIKSLKIDCDLITRGGGVQDLVRPKLRNFDRSVLRDADVSAKLHHADIIFLVNHENCGAYSGMDFSSREQELSQHYKDLRTARIKLFFAELKQDTDDVFIIRGID